MSDYPDVPDAVLGAVRALCSALPEVVEQRAWTGVRWQVRRKTFAHVVVVEPHRPQAYARAVGAEQQSTVLTFRSESPELDVLVMSGYPFFRTPWNARTVGMIIDSYDVGELRELLTDSYCAAAPTALANKVCRPTG